MVGKKYVYNQKTLQYVPVKKGIKDYLRQFAILMVLSVLMASGFVYTYSVFFDSPEEIQLKNDKNQLQTQLYIYGQKLDSIHSYLSEVEDRDDDLYRILLGEDPLQPEIRMAGIGGATFHFTEDHLVSQRDLDQAKARVAVQKASFDELTYKALQMEKEWESRPRITPIRNKDFVRFSSGFGFRIHPIYNIRKMHEGVDITARRGTPVYAAAPGKVVVATNHRDGYGNKVVIDHGNGYRTLYGHLNKILVKRGQQIDLATLIGEVGNTGGSVSDHLHYEVQKNGRPIDPSPYLYSLFSDEEFELLIASAN
jgi:murein DD-endopeptidase MepM/ murein hydrolase activator NlpD